MQNIGVSLVDLATGAELQSWPYLPREIAHEGETRTGAIVGALVGKNAQLVARVLDGEVPFGDPAVATETSKFNGESVVVTRTYSDANLAPIKDRLIADVKARAGQIILAYCPQHKQANLTAQASEIALTFPAVKGDDLPEPYRTAWVAGREIWGNIKAVRAHSDLLEAEIAACTTASALQAWQQHDWPVL